MPGFSETIAGDAESLAPRVAFISGYRRRGPESYRALNTVTRACEQAGANCLPISFDIIPLGKHKTLPPFSEMVQKSVSAINDNPAPTVLLGHCGGGAVAIEALKKIDPSLILGLVFLCPAFAPAEKTSPFRSPGAFVKRSLGWLHKNVFSSADYKAVHTNRRAYGAAVGEVFGDLTATTSFGIPKEKVIFIGTSEDRISSTPATQRFTSIHDFPYHLLQDDHSVRRPENMPLLANIIRSLTHASAPAVSC